MIEIQPNPYTGGKRLVAVGTLGNPETVTQRHFDAVGKDARSSHLERFIADGLDLTGFDLRDVTTLDGTIANSDMSTAQTNYFYSRRTVFPGTKMPIDTSSLNHDFARAILRAKALEIAIGTKSRDLLEWTASFIDPDSSDADRLSRDAYGNSWEPAHRHAIEVLGYSRRDVERFFRLAFDPFPKLAAREAKVMALAALSSEPFIPSWPVWKDADRVRAQLTNPNDRLEAQLLLDGDLDIVSPRHYVFQWEPDPYLFTIPSPRLWGWWEKSKA